MNRKITSTVILFLAFLLGSFLPSFQSSGLAQGKQPDSVSSKVDGEYRLGSEDVLQVWVWKEPDLSTTAVVRPDGKISLPLIGELEAAGKSAPQLQDEVQKKLMTYLAEPVVTVIVKEINSSKISVLGQVHKPDVYKIKRKTTVLDAIAMAGGFTDYAKRDKVIVIRNNPAQQQKIEVNLKHPDGQSPLYLESSDTVYVQ
jgi:polysaccharide export outer membrane protein